MRKVHWQSNLLKPPAGLPVLGLLAATLCLASPAASVAQGDAGNAAPVTPVQAPAASTPAAPQSELHPSMGDLMTLLVQPRHIKLGLAGSAGNWNYAAYEVGELRGAFRRVGQTMPIYNKQDFPALIAAMATEPLEAVRTAIERHDRAGFQSAYASLTAACNTCHASLHHAAVVIKAPGSSPYADQEFRSATTSPTAHPALPPH